MVKKSIFVIALLGMLATVSLAQDVPTPQLPGQLKIDTQWPYTCVVNWTPIDICTIKVYLKIGMFIEIDNCANLKINMVQQNCPSGQSFPCYQGCVTIKVRSNFDAIISVRKGQTVNNIINGNNWKVYFRADSSDPATNVTTWNIAGDGNFHQLDVCVQAWDANIFNSTLVGQYVQVGEVIISAIPASTVCPAP
jgi:hypothetical protein